MSEREPARGLPSRVYWWVAIAAIVEMLLLYWLTTAWNVPMPGGS